MQQKDHVTYATNFDWLKCIYVEPWLSKDGRRGRTADVPSKLLILTITVTSTAFGSKV